MVKRMKAKFLVVYKMLIQGVSQKSILKKVKSSNEKTLNFFNLNFKLAEGTIT